MASSVKRAETSEIRSAPFVTTIKLIINAVTPKEREAIVQALNNQSIFSGNPFSPLSEIGRKNETAVIAKPIKMPTSKVAEPESQRELNADNLRRSLKSLNKAAYDPDDIFTLKQSVNELRQLANVINLIAQESNMAANLHIEIIPQGLRILIQDNDEREMFLRGSAAITPFFSKLLQKLVPTLNGIDNKIIITGHTDALHYKKKNVYNNWNLSGDRALMARKVLENAGLGEGKILQVNAMSDQMLLDTERPDAAANRRIEIMVLTKTAADSLYQFFGKHGEKVIKPMTKHLENQLPPLPN